MITIIIISLLIGFLSAFVGSLVGLGGGIIFVPAMLFLYENFELFSWANPQAIVGISLITMIFTGLSSTITYYRQRWVDLRMGTIFLVASIPGSVIGSWLNARLDTDDFSLYFGILMVIVFVAMLIDREKLFKNKQLEITENTRTFRVHGETHQYNISLTTGFILAFFVGFLSGLFGIGGGTISVPAMILFFGTPIQIAVATSMFIIFFISIMSATTHIIMGHIVWKYVIFFIVGSYVGGSVGARASNLFKGRTLEWFLRIIIVFVAVRLVLESTIW